MWEGVPETEEANSQIRVRWRPAAEFPRKPDVPEPARTDRRPLSLSRQRPFPGAAAARHAWGWPDAAGRPALRHRKWPERLRSAGPGMAAQIPIPDADAQRTPGGIAHPFRGSRQSPDHSGGRPDGRARRPRNGGGPGRHRAIFHGEFCRRSQGSPKGPVRQRPQLFGRRPQGRLHHQSFQRRRDRGRRRPAGPSVAVSRQSVRLGLAGLARIRAARPDARDRRGPPQDRQAHRPLRGRQCRSGKLPRATSISRPP